MRVIKIIVFFAFLISNNVKAQETETFKNDIETHSVSGNVLGSSSLVGITYERVLSKKFIFEVGLGYVGLGTGITFYPFKIKKFNVCPYTGIKFSFLVLPEVVGAYGGYIPFGVTLFSKHRVNIGIDIGPALGKWEEGGNLHFEYDPTNPDYNPSINYNRSHKINVYGNLKIGFRF